MTSIEKIITQINDKYIGKQLFSRVISDSQDRRAEFPHEKFDIFQQFAEMQKDWTQLDNTIKAMTNFEMPNDYEGSDRDFSKEIYLPKSARQTLLQLHTCIIVLNHLLDTKIHPRTLKEETE